MAKLKQERHTAQNVTRATPMVYDKKEVGETAGESAPNDGPRPDRQRQRRKLRRFASWNVGSLTGKEKELVDEMKWRRIDNGDTGDKVGRELSKDTRIPGRSILEMVQQRELVVCNTWYRKKEEHIITFSSGG